MTIEKLIKTKSQSKDDIGKKGTDYELLKRKMQGICNSLNWASDEYDPNKTIISIKEYIEKEKRILYSEISGFYFSLNLEKQGDFISNVETLLVLCMGDRQYDEIKEHVLKIYDHVHLANYQLEKLQIEREDDELKSIIAQNLTPVKKKLERQIEIKVQKTQKELYAQLIALVGIFTAMAFLVFGSISSLDNIFNNFQEVSLCKLAIISCIWGLCVLNLISIFIFYVSKLTKLELDINCYRVIAWSNLIIICILIFSIWTYYIKRIGIDSWFNKIAKEHEIFISLAGFVVIAGLAIFSIVVLVRIEQKNVL